MFYSQLTLNGGASFVLLAMRFLNEFATVNIKAAKIYPLSWSVVVDSVEAAKELKDFRESATATTLNFQGTSEVFVFTYRMRKTGLGGYTSDPVAEEEKATDIARREGL